MSQVIALKRRLKSVFSQLERHHCHAGVQNQIIQAVVASEEFSDEVFHGSKRAKVAEQVREVNRG